MSDVTSNPSRPGSPSFSVMGANDLPTARPYRFVWDPSSRRPGPESVAGTTEGGRGDYIVGHTQYPLGVLNNPSSMNLELGALPAEWSSAKHGFHAISTVLNNPHKKQAPPKAHSSLPSVPPADLPRVRRKDFDSYLKAITPEWEKYERNSQLGKEGQAQIDAARLSTVESDDEDDESDAAGPSRKPTPSLFQGRQIPPLDSVPAVFFQQNFNLGDRITFAAVTEQPSAMDPTTPTPSTIRASFAQDDADTDPLSLSHSLPLLEKFSHYADTVEQHLIREISIRSTSFFAALTNLRDLQTSSTACLERIQSLREKLRQVDEGTAKKGLELVRAKRKEQRVGQVVDGVKMISGVVEMVSVAKGLVAAGQWGEALEVVEEMEDMWENVREDDPRAQANGSAVNGPSKLETMVEESETSPTTPTSAAAATGPLEVSPTSTVRRPHSTRPVPLSSLTSFASLPSHLQALTMEIAASLSAEFVAIMKDDWASYVESLPSAPILTETEKADAATAGRDERRDQFLSDRLKPLLLNLVRTKGLKEGLLSWREVVLSEINGFIVKDLPMFVQDQEQANGADASKSDSKQELANHLRSMSHIEFTTLMTRIYMNLLGGIERLKAQGDVIIELLKNLKPELRVKSGLSASGSRGDKSLDQTLSIDSLEEDLADILSSTSELANTQAARIISFRAEIHSKLNLPDFLLFFNGSWSFVVRCEVLSRRMIVGLRGTIVSQAKVWLQTFHQARITQSAKLVEDEVWNPVEVTSRLQHITSILVDGAVSDSPELRISLDQAEPPSSPPSTTEAPSATPDTAPPSTAPGSAAPSQRVRNKHLRIEDRSYYMVSATSEVITLLLDYIKVMVNMSLLTTDTMSRVIEFLKAFNSRTCQVVLGAGAMRSAGLKNITAKHLALASQSLSIIFHLIPCVRETFRRHLNQQQAVMLIEFDKLKRDYQEHQNEIHAKLIAIMGERLDSHIKSLRTVDWNVPKEGGGVNDYMLKLVKETVTLHTILSRYIEGHVVEYVMSEVLAAINHRLSEEFGRIDLPSQQAKERLLEDARYLHQHFSPLKHVKAPTQMLETVVTEKGLPRPAPTPSRSNTFTNQRLQGLLLGRNVGGSDKNLPNPGRTPTPPVAQFDTKSSTSPPRAPSSPSLATRNHLSNGLGTMSTQGSLSGSSLALPLEETVNTGTRQSGFRQVDPGSPLPTEPSPPGRHDSSNIGASPPLPPKPGDTTVP